jgi:hypothetical protein
MFGCGSNPIALWFARRRNGCRDHLKNPIIGTGALRGDRWIPFVFHASQMSPRNLAALRLDTCYGDWMQLTTDLRSSYAIQNFS